MGFERGSASAEASPAAENAENERMDEDLVEAATSVETDGDESEEHGPDAVEKGEKNKNAEELEINEDELKSLRERVTLIAKKFEKPFNSQIVATAYKEKYNESFIAAVSRFGYGMVASFLLDHPEFECKPTPSCFLFSIKHFQETEEDEGRMPVVEDYERVASVCCPGDEDLVKLGTFPKFPKKQRITIEEEDVWDKYDNKKDYFPDDHEKFLQKVLSVARFLPAPFGHIALKEAYLCKYRASVLQEASYFHYGSLEELVEDIPQIQLNENGTFSWIGERPKMETLEEVREGILEIAREAKVPLFLHSINDVYKDSFGEFIPFRKFGFESLKTFLMAHPGLENDPHPNNPHFRLRQDLENGDELPAEGGDGNKDATGTCEDHSSEEHEKFLQNVQLVVSSFRDFFTQKKFKNLYNLKCRHNPDALLKKFGYGSFAKLAAATPNLDFDKKSQRYIWTGERPEMDQDTLTDVREKVMDLVRLFEGPFSAGRVAQAYEQKHSEPLPFGDFGYLNSTEFLADIPVLEQVPKTYIFRKSYEEESAEGDLQNEGRNEQLATRGGSADDVTGPSQDQMSDEHKAFRQRVLFVAASFDGRFSRRHFKKFYRNAYDSPLHADARKHGYGESFEGLVGQFSELRMENDGSVSWIGKRPKIDFEALDEVRGRIVELLQEHGNVATAEWIDGEYRRKFGESIPFVKFKFPRLKSFLAEHPKLEKIPGTMHFRLKEDDGGEMKKPKKIENKRKSREKFGYVGYPAKRLKKEKDDSDSGSLENWEENEQEETMVTEENESMDEKALHNAIHTAEKLDEVKERGHDVEELGANALKMLDEGSE